MTVLAPFAIVALSAIAGLVARIAADPEIANPGTPRRVHCGLFTKPLLLFDFGGGLQHRHLVRADRETPGLILWGLWGLLGCSRARSIEYDNSCSQGYRSHNQDLLFHRSPPCWE